MEHTSSARAGLPKLQGAPPLPWGANPALVNRDFRQQALDIHAIVTETTPDGTIIDVNQKFCDVSGYSREELIGQNLRLINSGHHPRAFWTEMFRTLAREGYWCGEVCNRTKLGELYWLQCTNLAVRDASGRLTGYYSLRTEITASKQQYLALQSALAFKNALLQSASDSIVATDTDGIITSFNAAAEALLGCRADEVVNRQSPALWHDPEEVVARAAELTRELGRPVEPGLDAFVAKVKETRQPDVREWTCIRSDGTRFPARLAVTPVIDARGAMIGYIGIAHDITELKAHQQALTDAARAAEAATAAKSQFLANMSHEIRTPLNGVLGMTSFLLDTPLSATQREYAETIQRSGHALLDVINEVLDFSKIEAGRLEMEVLDFSPRDVAEGVAEIVAVSARPRGIELVVDVQDEEPLVMSGDPTRVRQVLTNLAANAVKFSPEGSTVVLRLASTRSTDADGTERARVRYEVEDQGIGIEAQALQRLFAPFTQADATTTRRYGGTGLGLAICKRLTEMMGGEIGARSLPGEGSTFWFTHPGPVRQAAALEAIPRLTGRRVLCVEPNALVQRALTDLLRREGARVVPVASGDAALTEVASAGPFDVVISACTLPDMRGPELVEQLGAISDKRRPRTILLSSRGDAPQTPGAACADVVLLKPVAYQRLINAMTPSRADSRLAPQDDGSPLQGVRILVAEDDPVNLLVIRTMLRKFGAQVVTAETGREAVASFNEGGFDVVLMDFHMPEMDGLEATKIIRASELSRSEPRTIIIALTANAMASAREEAIEAGMDGYLTKPIDGPKLLDLIRTLRPLRVTTSAV